MFICTKEAEKYSILMSVKEDILSFYHVQSFAWFVYDLITSFHFFRTYWHLYIMKKFQNANSLSVPVSALTLSPTELSVNSGNIISLECQTNYCNPPSTIIWYLGDKKISGHINVTIDTTSTGLSRTISVLQYTAVTSDDGNPIFCTASNIEGHTIASSTNVLNVRCEFFILI